MSRYRWIISFCILYHLVALTVDAVPRPFQLGRVTPIRHPIDDALSGLFTPGFDRVGTWLASVQTVLFAVAERLRPFTEPYVNLGLRQKWDMFTNPSTDARYVRLAYYVAASAGENSAVRVRELVFPLGREDRIRILHDFRDKAVVNAMDSFAAAAVARRDFLADPHAAGPLPPDPAKSSELVTLARYFEDRYRHRYLTGTERITRVEVWIGGSPMAPRGDIREVPAVERHLDALRRYYDGPIASPWNGARFPSPGTREQESDILWELDYVSP